MKLFPYSKLDIFFKVEKASVIDGVRNTLHILIAEGLYLFIGQSK